MRRVALAALATLLLPTTSARAVDPSLRPVPIGRGPEYMPAAPPAPALRAVPGGLRAATRVHLELFAGGLVVVVPGGIGISPWRETLYGRVTDALWHADAWTLQPGGVVELARPGMTLGEVFRAWDRRLGPRRMLGFRGRVRTYANGIQRPGGPASLVLHDGDEVVLEVGPYVSPHRSFAFPP